MGVSSVGPMRVVGGTGDLGVRKVDRIQLVEIRRVVFTRHTPRRKVVIVRNSVDWHVSGIQRESVQPVQSSA